MNKKEKMYMHCENNKICKFNLFKKCKFEDKCKFRHINMDDINHMINELQRLRNENSSLKKQVQSNNKKMINSKSSNCDVTSNTVHASENKTYSSLFKTNETELVIKPDKSETNLVNQFKEPSLLDEKIMLIIAESLKSRDAEILDLKAKMSEIVLPSLQKNGAAISEVQSKVVEIGETMQKNIVKLTNKLNDIDSNLQTKIGQSIRNGMEKINNNISSGIGLHLNAFLKNFCSNNLSMSSSTPDPTSKALISSGNFLEKHTR